MNSVKVASCVAAIGCLLGGWSTPSASAQGYGGFSQSSGHYSSGYYYGGAGYGSGYRSGHYTGFGFGGAGGGYAYGPGSMYSGPVWYNSKGYFSPPLQFYPAYVTPQAPVSIVPTVAAADGGEIVLFVPADAATGISYTLNGQPHTLKPGESHQFTNDRQWTIEFGPTTGGQIALRYTLVSARYKFKASGSGMGLFQTQDLPQVPAVLPPAPKPSAN